VPALSSAREKFAALNAQVLDISTDSTVSHVAWQKKELGTVNIPMCSDFFPHADVTKKFGILRQGPPVPGICERAVFIADKDGKITFVKVYPLDQVPNLEELLSEVKKAGGQSKSVFNCPQA
jgi:alkyl hydroperoxide reductase subunit AhpC